MFGGAGGASGFGGGMGGGGFGGPRPGASPQGPGAKASNVVPVTEREFEREVLRSELPVVIAFVAERHPSYRTTGAELAAFADELVGKVKVVSVDVERSPVVVRQLRVESVPTFMVFAGGRIVDAIAGPANKKQLRELVDPFLPRAEGALKARELAELLKTGAVVPVDTRDANAFKRAHLPGAKPMPLEEIEGRLAELHMFAGQPVLYCRSGDKTKDLAAKLAESGMPVAFLEGGLLAWEAEGLPIER